MEEKIFINSTDNIKLCALIANISTDKVVLLCHGIRGNKDEIGHNGAGKTTTLKSIAGILDFEEGDILINGKSIKKEPIACKMQMAYVPDNPDLYENMKAYEGNYERNV